MDLIDRRQFLLLSAGAVSTTALSACSKDKSSKSTAAGTTDSTAAPRPTLRLAGGDFGFPSPFGYSRGPGYWRMSYIYDTLLWKDSTGTLLPWLATRQETSPDGRTHTFTLRDGVKWHDGQPFTAEDVVFTFEYFRGKQLSPQIFVRPQGVVGVKATDARTVEVQLNAPVVTFTDSVAGALPIIPRHIWSAVEDPTKASDPVLLVGTGPYKLESYSRGEGAYLYSANDAFFLGRPFVKRIEMRPVGDDLTALLSGDIDAGGPQPTGVQGDALAPFRGNPEFGILEGPEDFTLGLYWNLKKGGVLADARFRQACCYAIDRADIVQRLTGGRGDPGNPGFLPPTNAWYAKVEQYAFDVARANSLLDTAGYTRSGAGVRQGPDGPLKFSLLVANDPVPPVTDLLVSSLKAIGVEMTAQAVDRATHDTRTANGDYEMAVTNFGGLGGDPDYLRQLYSSKVPKRFQSVSGYANAAFDQIADEQLVTVDKAKRGQLISQMQELVAADVPMLPLYYPRFFHIYRKAVFDQWYFTPGGFASGIPTVYNKQAFVTGRKKGLEIRPVTTEGN